MDRQSADYWHDPDDDFEIDDGSHYLVKTNGEEWRESSLYVWPGIMLRKIIEQERVRQRPVRVALINDPQV